MPAISNSQNSNKKTSIVNGSSSQETVSLKEKIMMLEEKIGNSNQTLDDNNNYNNNQSDTDEVFGDTQTVGVHPKFSSGSNDEKIPIFGDQNNEQQQGPFGQSVKDQFAISLLRLQKDLDATNFKLNEVETRIDAIYRQNSLNQEKLNKQTKNNKSSLFNRDNMFTLMYFGWPVVVFIAMRAFERRSITGGRVA